MKLIEALRQDRSWLRISSGHLLALLLVQSILAVVITVILAKDPNWARWHISYLGEGSQFSAHFFNMSMWLTGLIAAGFAVAIYHELSAIRSNNPHFSKVKPKAIAAGLIAIALCIYLIGLFPRSYGILPHDIFGHLIYFIFLAMSVASPWLLPGMPRWFYVSSLLFHGVIFGLFIMYWSGISESLYLAEVATFGLFVTWIQLIRRVMLR